jgi:hypothetical protein
LKNHGGPPAIYIIVRQRQSEALETGPGGQTEATLGLIRHPGLQLVSEVFQGALEALASREGANADQLRTIGSVRAALFDALETSPMGKDPVTTMKLRAIIAAGFEAAVSDFEQNQAEDPQARPSAPLAEGSPGPRQTTI